MIEITMTDGAQYSFASAPDAEDIEVLRTAMQEGSVATLSYNGVKLHPLRLSLATRTDSNRYQTASGGSDYCGSNQRYHTRITYQHVGPIGALSAIIAGQPLYATADCKTYILYR